MNQLAKEMVSTVLKHSFGDIPETTLNKLLDKVMNTKRNPGQLRADPGPYCKRATPNPPCVCVRPCQDWR